MVVEETEICNDKVGQAVIHAHKHRSTILNDKHEIMLSKHNGFDTQTQAVNPYYIHLRSNIKSLLGNDVHKQKPRVRRRELTVD